MSEWIPFGGRWSCIPSDRGMTLAEWEVHSAQEDRETFCGLGLNKPGTQVDVDGKYYLIGDISREGGATHREDCMPFSPIRYVRKYRVLIQEGEL